MAGLYSSLNTGLSALRYQQSALDVASTNIANASTDGYVRRRIVGQTVGAAAAPAVWSRSNEIGSGVEPTGVQRLTDALLDARVRREHGRQSFLDTKAEALARIETGIAEPSDTGVAAAITKFRSSLHDLANAPGSSAARSQVLSAASILADAFNIQVRNLDDEASDQQARLAASLQEVNDVATQLAATNSTIAAMRGQGSDMATLMDTRDQLALRLSELTGATASVNSAGGMDVTLDGNKLVEADRAGSLSKSTVTSGPPPVTTTVVAMADTDGMVATSITLPEGSVGGTLELINGDIPAYRAELTQLMADFASAMNDQQAAGYNDADPPALGAPMFTVGADGRLALALSDPSDVAASLSDTLQDGGNASLMATAIEIDDPYQRLVNVFGSNVASTQRLAANQRTMATQVDSAREQLAGVSIDEETVNMVLAQRSYEAAARVMTTVDQMLDTLINRTGLVGR